MHPLIGNLVIIVYFTSDASGKVWYAKLILFILLSTPIFWILSDGASPSVSGISAMGESSIKVDNVSDKVNNIIRIQFRV